MSENLYHGLFSLESVASCILFVSKDTINESGILHISRHIQTSKLFNPTTNCNYPGLSIIGRDVGISDYDADFATQENERIKQDREKLKHLKERLQEKTGINFNKKNLKYIAEPPLDMSKLLLNSLKDLCKFIIKNSQTQNNKTYNQIIDKFNKHQKMINKHPELLCTEEPMEIIFNMVFSKEIEDVKNKIKDENKESVNKKVDSYGISIIQDTNKKIYNILSDVLQKFEKEADSRYPGIKSLIESEYNLKYEELRSHYLNLIIERINKNLKNFGIKVALTVTGTIATATVVAVSSVALDIIKFI